MPTLTNQDGVHVLHLGEDDNRFSLDWLTDVDKALDQVVESPAPLVTIAEGSSSPSRADQLARRGRLRGRAVATTASTSSASIAAATLASRVTSVSLSSSSSPANSWACSVVTSAR